MTIFSVCVPLVVQIAITAHLQWMLRTIIALIPFALSVSGVIPSTFMLKVHCFIDSEVHALL
jgi:hypothetical protein